MVPNIIIIEILFLLVQVSSFGIFSSFNNWRGKLAAKEPDPIDKIYGLLGKIALETAKNTENIKDLTESSKILNENTSRNIDRMVKSIEQLTSYNQNRDINLEDSIAISLKRYIVDSLGIPEEFVLQYSLKKIYNPTTGEVASEWDAIFLIDYSDKPLWVCLKQNLPPHNTIIILEAKQNLNVTDFKTKLPKRIKKTKDAINSAQSNKRSIKCKVAAQVAFFLVEPQFIVAVGSRNMNSTLAAEMANLGCLAFGPSGADFFAVSKSYEIFP
jgi:hypothetical protein